MVSFLQLKSTTDLKIQAKLFRLQSLILVISNLTDLETIGILMKYARKWILSLFSAPWLLLWFSTLFIGPSFKYPYTNFFYESHKLRKYIKNILMSYKCLRSFIICVGSRVKNLMHFFQVDDRTYHHLNPNAMHTSSLSLILCLDKRTFMMWNSLKTDYDTYDLSSSIINHENYISFQNFSCNNLKIIEF